MKLFSIGGRLGVIFVFAAVSMGCAVGATSESDGDAQSELRADDVQLVGVGGLDPTLVGSGTTPVVVHGTTMPAQAACPTASTSQAPTCGPMPNPWKSGPMPNPWNGDVNDSKGTGDER